MARRVSDDERPRSPEIELCYKWYTAFEQKNLDSMMSLFTDDVVVVIGAGKSSLAVPYSGTFCGQAEVREYYRRRFSKRLDPFGQFKPFCAMAPSSPAQFGPWVLFWGKRTDRVGRNRTTFDGPILDVWTIDPIANKLSSLEMYFDLVGRIPMRAPARGGNRKSKRA